MSKSKLIISLLLLLVPVVSLALDVSGLKPAPYEIPEMTGELENRRIDEASGMSRSGFDPERFWVINDGGNNPLLFAINREGHDLGTFRVGNVRNYDWEDLAGFTRGNESFLAIADVGDNRSVRPYSYIYIVREPENLSKPGKKHPLLKTAWRIQFEFSNGPRDCESIAVDVENGRILLLSKRNVPAVVYELPLLFEGKAKPLKATPVINLKSIPQPGSGFLLSNPFYGRYASQPTAMDISADGLQMAVLTYTHGYLFKRSKKEGWQQALDRQPKLIQLPPLTQMEAWCFDWDNNILVTTEKLPAPVYQLNRNK